MGCGNIEEGGPDRAAYRHGEHVAAGLLRRWQTGK
jgi:hypothetical protein